METIAQCVRCWAPIKTDGLFCASCFALYQDTYRALKEDAASGTVAGFGVAGGGCLTDDVRRQIGPDYQAYQVEFLGLLLPDELTMRLVAGEADAIGAATVVIDEVGGADWVAYRGILVCEARVFRDGQEILQRLYRQGVGIVDRGPIAASITERHRQDALAILNGTTIYNPGGRPRGSSVSEVAPGVVAHVEAYARQNNVNIAEAALTLYNLPRYKYYYLRRLSKKGG